jgi:hypothetical protein
MASDETIKGAGDAPDEMGLPPHLAALVGALQGPPDLGVHHDRYLTYPHREETDGAATA